MAKFLPALQPMKELMVWEEEISLSLIKLYEAQQWGRKQWVKKFHTQWHLSGNTAIGYFTARQSDFLEVWFGWCQANGTKMEKYLAEKMFELVHLLHSAFASTRRDHKQVKTFDHLMQMAEMVMEDEEALVGICTV
ncbi:unnamed protein product, partial [Durusdinium trenchii]